MTFHKGDVSQCPDPACECELTVTTGAQPGQRGNQLPTCWWQDDGEEALNAARRDDAPRHIGALAAQLGLNPKTIRYYEQLGLLPPPTRTDSGYRLYDGRDEARLRFILQAKAIGLTLAEVGAILTVPAGGSLPCAYVLTLLDQKVAEINRRLAALTQVRAELVRLRREAAHTMHTRATQPEVCGSIEAQARATPNGTPRERR
jgi:DNA-binding transcriptional MerR regulator